MRLLYNEWPQHFTDVPKVFLNGLVMTDVIEADEEAGHVVVYETDANGNYLKDRGDSYRRRKITGRVSIEGKPKPPAAESTEIDYTSFCGFWKAPSMLDRVPPKEVWKILGFDPGCQNDVCVVAEARFDAARGCWIFTRIEQSERA